MVALTKWVDAQVFKQLKRQRLCFAYLSSDDLSALLNHEKLRQLFGDQSIGDLTQFAGAVGARYVMALKVDGVGSKIFIRGSTIDTKRAKAPAMARAQAQNGDDAVDVINDFADELVRRSDLPVCRTREYAGEPKTVGNTNKTNTATGTDFWDETLEAAIEMVPGSKPTVHYEITFNQLSAVDYRGGCNGREESGLQNRAAGDSPIEMSVKIEDKKLRIEPGVFKGMGKTTWFNRGGTNCAKAGSALPEHPWQLEFQLPFYEEPVDPQWEIIQGGRTDPGAWLAMCTGKNPCNSKEVTVFKYNLRRTKPGEGQ
jgi:hypothetical protein